MTGVVKRRSRLQGSCDNIGQSCEKREVEGTAWRQPCEYGGELLKELFPEGTFMLDIDRLAAFYAGQVRGGLNGLLERAEVVHETKLPGLLA